MTESTRVQIDKLNNENYDLWKYKMELLLIKEDLWSKVTTARPAALDAAGNAIWEKEDNKARATICLLIEDNQIQHVKAATTAKLAWDALKAYHENSTLSGKVFLLKSIVNQRLEEGGDMEEHLNTALSKMGKLAAIGEILVDSLQIAIILAILPESSSTLVTALEARPTEDLTLSLVKGKLIDEFKRRRVTDDEIQTDSAFRAHEKSQWCNFCKKLGHSKPECDRYKVWKAKKDKKEYKGKEKASQIVEDNKSDEEEKDSWEYCFVTRETKSTANTWCIDSGATSHMSGDR